MQVCDRYCAYVLVKVRADETYRKPPTDIGDCDWRGMTEAEQLAAHPFVCPKHRELARSIDRDSSSA